MTRKQEQTVSAMRANLLKADKRDGFELIELCFKAEPGTKNVIAKVEYSRILVNVIDGNTLFYRILPNGKKVVMAHIAGTIGQMIKFVDAMPTLEIVK